MLSNEKIFSVILGSQMEIVLGGIWLISFRHVAKLFNTEPGLE